MTAGQNESQKNKPKTYTMMQLQGWSQTEIHEGRGLFYSLVLPWLPETGVFETEYIINKYLKNTSRH